MYEGKCWFMQHAPTYNMVSLEKSSTKVTDLLLFFSAGSEGTSNISRKGERPAMAEPQRLTFQKPYPTKGYIVLKTYEILRFLPELPEIFIQLFC